MRSLPSPGPRAATAPLAAVWLLAIAVALVGTFANLGASEWRTDEPVYRNAAAAIAEYGNFSHNLEHPPVAKYLIVASTQAFGFEPWAVRLPSALAALVAGLLLAALAARIARGVDPRAAGWAAVATFATWTWLPHPDPAFDTTRLAYLDVPMAMFAAAAMYAAWRWQDAASWRWAVATGVLSGLAVATKLPALALAAAFVVLVLARPERRRLVLQYAAIVAIALVVFVATWLPFGREIPEAWRFMLAMQLRGGGPGADPLQQLAWQWDAWPAFALVQLLALVAAPLLLPRRATVFLAACVLLPALTFAVGSGRIHPHWQVAWQPGMAVLVGLASTTLAIRAHRSQRHAGMALALAMVSSIVVLGVQRADRAMDQERSDLRRAYALLADVDRPGAIVIDDSNAHVERALTFAHVLPSYGTYHSAADNQHEWFSRAGGRPLEPDTFRLSRRDEMRAAAIVLDTDAASGLPRSPDDFDQHEIGDLEVWIKRTAVD